MQKSAVFYERLVTRRNALNLTQHGLAEASGVSVRSISSYEQGTTDPSLEHLLKLAQALKVTVGWLLGEDDKSGIGGTPALHEASSTYSTMDRESVRLALRSLRGQTSALMEQIAFYERQLCGAEASSEPKAQAQERIVGLVREEAARLTGQGKPGSQPK